MSEIEKDDTVHLLVPREVRFRDGDLVVLQNPDGTHGTELIDLSEHDHPIVDLGGVEG